MPTPRCRRSAARCESLSATKCWPCANRRSAWRSRIAAQSLQFLKQGSTGATKGLVPLPSEIQAPVVPAPGARGLLMWDQAASASARLLSSHAITSDCKPDHPAGPEVDALGEAALFLQPIDVHFRIRNELLDFSKPKGPLGKRRHLWLHYLRCDRMGVAGDTTGYAAATSNISALGVTAYGSRRDLQSLVGTTTFWRSPVYCASLGPPEARVSGPSRIAPCVAGPMQQPGRPARAHLCGDI